jgi:hypothetical protein
LFDFLPGHIPHSISPGLVQLNHRRYRRHRQTTPAPPTKTSGCSISLRRRLDSGQGYSYDSSGNTTADAEGRTFVYDAENTQAEVIESSVSIGEYFYDGDGKRVKKFR